MFRLSVLILFWLACQGCGRSDKSAPSVGKEPSSKVAGAASSPLRPSAASSVQELAQIVRDTYERKDPETLIKYFDSEGAPPDLHQAIMESIRSMWGTNKLVVASVDVHAFADYQPTTNLPGQFKGRKLAWVAAPTAWIVVKCESPKTHDDHATMTMKFEMPAVEKSNGWWIVGSKYAE